VAEADAAGVDLIHVDVMDGHFVPTLSLGFGIIEAVRRSTALPLDVHLMIEHPERFLAEFKRVGATYLTVHQEAVLHLHRVLAEIRDLGMKAGVALNPATPLVNIEEVLTDLDLLLVMTIDPGYGGQSLIPETIRKVERARHLLDSGSSSALLSVDGGVKAHNVARLAAAGADVLVVGTGIFHASGGVAAGVAELRSAQTAAR
jgi:ribulose-phosphate 3-epimerase